MKKIWLFAAVAALAAGLAACGGGGGGGGGTTTALKGLASCSAIAGEAVICGTVYAPDGRTPIVGAEIMQSTAAAMTVSLKGLTADGFGKTDANPDHCYTDATGAFACGGILAAGLFNGQITGAGYTINFTFDNLLLNEANNIPASSTTAGGGTGTYKYAVVSGSFDSIEDLLARILACGTLTGGALDIGTECAQIELIDFSGTNPNTALTNVLGLPAGTYPTLTDFLKNANTAQALALFRGVFFNCGMSEAYINDAEVQAALRTYVQNGGNLYASDWAYDYIEKTWPDAIDFYGDDTVDGDAKDGNTNSSQPVNVTNENLLTWLRAEGLVGAADTTFNVNFNLGGWVVMVTAGNQILTATSLPNGVGGIIPYTPATPIPVTVDFKDGSGCAFYTSYHNEPADQVGANATQSRVLEYLLFNRFGNCS